MKRIAYSKNMGEVNSGPEQAAYRSTSRTPEDEETAQSIGPNRRGFLKMAAAIAGATLATAAGWIAQATNPDTAREAEDMQNEISRRNRARQTAEAAEPKFIPPQNVPQNRATMEAINKRPTSTPEVSPTPTPSITPVGK